MPNRMEELTSKGAGKVGAAAAGLKGLRGVFNKLAEEHKEVSMLIKRAKAASDPDKRADLWPKIRKELLSHEKAERQEVYGALSDYPDLQSIVQQHEDHSKSLEDMIQQLDNIAFTSNAWQPTLGELEDLVQEHVDDEENNYFPQAQKVIPDDLRDDLERRFMAKKEQVMETL